MTFMKKSICPRQIDSLRFFLHALHVLHGEKNLSPLLLLSALSLTLLNPYSFLGCLQIVNVAKKIPPLRSLKRAKHHCQARMRADAKWRQRISHCLAEIVDNKARFPVEIGPTRLTAAGALCYAHRCPANDGLVKRPISALRVSLVTAAYDKYAAFGTRDSGIPRDSQAVSRPFYQTVCNVL